ncbi:8830_t:CDS:2, partial [Racocetra persica]
EDLVTRCAKHGKIGMKKFMFYQMPFLNQYTDSSLSVIENYLVVVTNLNQITVQKHPNYGWTVTAEAVRTDESVSFTQQQIKQLIEAQKQDNIRQSELLTSLLQNPEATPNITATIWKSTISNVNTSYVLQAPDAIYFFVGVRDIKLHLYEFARKGFFPLNGLIAVRIIKSTKALLSNTFNHDPKTLYCQIDFVSVIGTPGWEEFASFGKRMGIYSKCEFYLSDVLSEQIKQFEKVRA